jgi:hypothetical protein
MSDIGTKRTFAALQYFVGYWSNSGHWRVGSNRAVLCALLSSKNPKKIRHYFPKVSLGLVRLRAAMRRYLGGALRVNRQSPPRPDCSFRSRAGGPWRFCGARQAAERLCANYPLIPCGRNIVALGGI